MNKNRKLPPPWPRATPVRPRTDLLRIKGILANALSNKGLDRKIDRYEFVLRWKEIVGERFAQITKPEAIQGQTLVVRVRDSVWAQELVFCKAFLIERVQPHLAPGDHVENIRFLVGPDRR